MVKENTFWNQQMTQAKYKQNKKLLLTQKLKRNPLSAKDEIFINYFKNIKVTFLNTISNLCYYNLIHYRQINAKLIRKTSYVFLFCLQNYGMHH